MSDYSGLTDDQLRERIAAAQAAKPKATTDYSHLSDAELKTRIAAAQAGRAPATLQEMHPDFTAADRFVVKNFSTNNEAAVNYLQKRHPNLEVAVDDRSGQIKARARDGKDGGAYRVLDPDTGFFSSDILNDAGDVAYDTISGIGTGLATGAAGVAGAAAGGIGAVPAAMGAGAGTSAFMEGLKQAIGSGAGLENNFSGADLALATGAGAVSPLLLGTGATAGQVAKGALKQGLDEAGTAALKASQRGLGGRLVDATVKPALTKIGSTLSGASEDSLKGLAQNYDEFAKIEANPQGSRTFAKETAQELGGTLRKAKQAYGETFQAGVDSLPPETMVDITPARAALEDAVAKADETALASGTAGSKQLAARLRQALHDNFYRAEEVVGADGEAVSHLIPNDALPVKAALDLEKDLAELAGFDKLGAGNVKGGIGNRFAAGAGREGKVLGTAAANAKKQLEVTLGQVIPEEAMAAKAKLGGVLNMEKEAGDILGKKPKKIMKALRNISKPSNRENLELLHQLDTDFGTSMVERARMAGTLGTFSKPGPLPLSSGGVSGLARAGTAAGLGAAAGQYLERKSGEGSGLQGAILGGAAAGLAGNPYMMRKYIQMGLTGGKINQFLGPARVGLGAQALEETSPWLGIKP